jgi:UDP-N-acetylglucosamine acyltransferase
MTIDASAVIHPSAVVEAGATVGPGCRIGPFCLVGPEVVLGREVVLHSHVVVTGVTRIGDGTEVWPFASLGHRPQDLKYRGERTRLEIGARNMIREYVTMNPGTEGGGGLTRVGDGGLYMMGVHVGHDAQVGDGVVLANYASLGGHVEIGDNVVVGALAGIHQWVRVGKGAMIGGLAAVVADVIPHGTVAGERASLVGLNLVGLKRRNAPREEVQGLRAAFATLFGSGGSLQERAEGLAGSADGNALLSEVTAFILARTARHFTLPKAGAAVDDA